MKFESNCIKSWGTVWGLHFYKKTDKIYKNALFFTIFSIFVFRCMVKQP